ncbi:MAG: hypothetical protein ACLFR1_08610 [Spirochaetia bacterium]
MKIVHHLSVILREKIYVILLIFLFYPIASNFSSPVFPNVMMSNGRTPYISGSTGFSLEDHYWVSMLEPATEVREAAYYLDASFQSYYNRNGAWLEQQISPSISTESNLRMDYFSQNFSFFGSLSVINDDKYSSSHSEWNGLYSLMRSGGISFFAGPVSAFAARSRHFDAVTTPYALFANAVGPSVLHTDLSYNDPPFFYRTRWILLNRDSGEGYPDRGANLHFYGITLPWGMFFGFQGAAVYTGDFIDPEFFFNPVPMFFSQYSLNSQGKPWEQTGNDNYIMGYFWEWDTRETDVRLMDYPFYAQTQILIDDFATLPFLRISDEYMNPNKIAWNLGGRLFFRWGSAGFYHGGATKYTFQPTGNANTNLHYGYNYYPAVTYGKKDGTIMPILSQDNAIGFQHGENCIAFMTDVSAEIGMDQNEFSLWSGRLYGSLEYTVTADQSPANPWHQYTWFPREGNENPTRLLDSEVLEHRLSMRLSFEKTIGDFTLLTGVFFGHVWNQLGITPVPEELAVENVNDIPYFSPQPGQYAFFFTPLFSLSYTFSY